MCRYNCWLPNSMAWILTDRTLRCPESCITDVGWYIVVIGIFSRLCTSAFFHICEIYQQSDSCLYLVYLHVLVLFVCQKDGHVDVSHRNKTTFSSICRYFGFLRLLLPILHRIQALYRPSASFSDQRALQSCTARPNIRNYVTVDSNHKSP